MSVFMFFVLCLADTKLAPIFEKRTKQQQHSANKPAPVLTEAEKQALEVRRAFLTSGVPEELRRQKPCVFVPVTDTYSCIIWPTDSHVQQRPTTAVDIEQVHRQCDPWSLQSCHLPCRKFFVGNVSLASSLTLGLFTNVLEKADCLKPEVFMLYFLSVFCSKFIC